jgi:hypothetical protein
MHYCKQLENSTQTQFLSYIMSKVVLLSVKFSKRI